MLAGTDGHRHGQAPARVQCKHQSDVRAANWQVEPVVFTNPGHRAVARSTATAIDGCELYAELATKQFARRKLAGGWGHFAPNHRACARRAVVRRQAKPLRYTGLEVHKCELYAELATEQFARRKLAAGGGHFAKPQPSCRSEACSCSQTSKTFERHGSGGYRRWKKSCTTWRQRCRL